MAIKTDSTSTCIHTDSATNMDVEDNVILGYDLGYKIEKPPLNVFRSGF